MPTTAPKIPDMIPTGKKRNSLKNSKSVMILLPYDQVNLKIPRHQIFVIVGPSGSGKTTLLRLINRLIELSGGEQQRVGVARALAIRPRLILMDEPFSALDPINRQKLQDLVLKLHQKLNNTIVFVTHDMHEALKMGQRIAVLYHGRIFLL
ncbi:MAG: Hypothetical protein AJITA_00826 [Acetilactobacillus jinshanensis]